MHNNIRLESNIVPSHLSQLITSIFSQQSVLKKIHLSSKTESFVVLSFVSLLALQQSYTFHDEVHKLICDLALQWQKACADLRQNLRELMHLTMYSSMQYHCFHTNYKHTTGTKRVNAPSNLVFSSIPLLLYKVMNSLLAL